MSHEGSNKWHFDDYFDEAPGYDDKDYASTVDPDSHCESLHGFDVLVAGVRGSNVQFPRLLLVAPTRQSVVLLNGVSMLIPVLEVVPQ